MPKRISLGFLAVLALEFLDPARGIDQLLLARKEGMAVAANFDLDFFAGRARLVSISACAAYLRDLILRMNSGLHIKLPSKANAILP